jgi:REP element-mobilizing transposase RayT
MNQNNTTIKAGYVIRDQTLPHFITATVVDWIDVFTQKTYRDTVIECFDYCITNKAMVLYGYVIMSNHVHLIVQSSDGKLSDLIRDFKKFIATKILEKIQLEPESRREWMLERFKLATESHSRNKNYQFWQYGNHPEEIYTNKFMWSKLDYIHLNPVRAGIVEKASQYIYSSASYYVYDTGLLEIEKAENPIVDVLNPNSFTKYNLY